MNVADLGLLLLPVADGDAVQPSRMFRAQNATSGTRGSANLNLAVALGLGKLASTPTGKFEFQFPI